MCAQTPAHHVSAHDRTTAESRTRHANPQARPGPRPGVSEAERSARPLAARSGPHSARSAGGMRAGCRQSSPLRFRRTCSAAPLFPRVPGGSGPAAPSQCHGGSGSGALLKLKRRHAPTYIRQRRWNNAQDGYTLCDRSSRPVAGATAHIADSARWVGASMTAASVCILSGSACSAPKGPRRSPRRAAQTA